MKGGFYLKQTVLENIDCDILTLSNLVLKFAMKSYKLYILVLVLSIFPLVHIFINQGIPHTSDGLMHIARSASYYKEMMGGQIPVRWSSQFDYGYGTPIFNYFNPLPYFVGALLIWAGLSLTLILKAGFAITYLLTGIFMLMFCRAYFKDNKTALFATLMYQFAPFRLVEMLVRGDLGSLYSYMILPLVFYAITKLLEKTTLPRFALLAISIGLLPLGHNINGFVFFILVIIYTFFASQNIKKIIITFAAMGFGLLLAGYFIFPALLELKYTNGYIFSKDLFFGHFPPLYKLFLPNITNLQSLRVAEVSVQVGLFHTFSFIAVIYLLLKNKLEGKAKLFAIYLLFISLIAFIFIEPISKPLWENIKFLRQFQFPWRFLSIIIFTSSVLSAFAIQKIALLRKKYTYIVITGLVIVSTIFYWAPYQGYQKIDEKYYYNYPGSTNYFAEVNTIWMAHEPVEFPKKRVEIIAGNGTISNIKIAPLTHVSTVDAKTTVTLVDRTYFFPGWKVMIDNVSVPIEFQDQNYRGLITFNVPTGNHNVIVSYGEDKIQKASDFISIIAAAILIMGMVIHLFKKHEKTHK